MNNKLNNLLKINLENKKKQNNLNDDFKNFWELNILPNNIYEVICNKLKDFSFWQYLEKLSYEETQFLYILIKNNGHVTYVKILEELNKVDENNLNKISTLLNNKCLIFIRKSISQIKVVAHSYGIYEEINQKIKELSIIQIQNIKEDYFNNSYENNLNKIEKKNNSSIFSNKLENILKINIGQCHFKTLCNMELEREVKQHIKNKELELTLLIVTNKFYLIVKIPSTKLHYLNKNKIEYKEIQPKRMFFITGISLIFYLLKTRGLFLTNQKLLRKHDNNTLLSCLHKNQLILNEIIEFLYKYEFINIKDKQYKESKKLIKFLEKNYDDQYKEILLLKPNVEKIFNYIISLNKNYFNHWDLLINYVKNNINKKYKVYDPYNDNNENLNENTILKSLNFLVYIGLINSTKIGFKLSSIGLKLAKKINKNKIRNDAIMVTNDLKIIVYLNKICDEALHLIDLFSDIQENENNEKSLIWQYSINRKSVQRGVFLNYSYIDFINCLNTNSSQVISENILYNIESWAKCLKTLKIKRVNLIEGSEEILQQLKCHDEMKNKIKVIHPNYLICNDEKMPFCIESGYDIFLLKSE